MIGSQIRRRAAQVIAPGIARVAEEVVAALNADSTTAAPAALDRICAEATAQVPFYQRLGAEDFSGMPVVNKAMMQERPEDFRSTAVDPKKLSSTTTSGSTGTPFRAWFDPVKVTRHRGQLAGSYQYLGVDPFGWFVHSRAWSHVSPALRMRYALKGQYLYAGERDPATVAAVAQWMTRHPGVTLMGYSSYIEDLLHGLEAGGFTFPAGTVGTVMGGSEPSTSYLATGSQRLFGVTPHMRYANMELGVMAVTGPDLTAYRIDTSSFHVEVLEEDSDTPAAPGRVGRVVVTDLFNTAMPFIRYDTGDLARFAVNDSGQPVPNVLTELSGRRFDILVAGTPQAPRRASALLLPDDQILEAGPIRQFQLRQTGVGRFTWLLNAEPADGMEPVLRGILDDVVGDIVECRFVYTEEIPMMNSGKRKLFVNEMADIETVLATAD